MKNIPIVLKVTGVISRVAFSILFLVLSIQPVFAQKTYTGSDGVEVTISDMSRIVSIGAAVTETIYALDAADKLIAVDESSIYPDETADLTKVSFTRNLSAEGILSTSPSLILASGSAGPETTIKQIRSTRVPLLKLTDDETVAGAFERIEQLGQILDREGKADEIIEDLKKELDKAHIVRNELSHRPTVLFIYARGPHNLMVAGNKTSAKTIIELAGGVNAFDDFDKYKPLTSEAVVTVNPDVILMMDSGLQSLGGEQGILDAPGIELTDAAKNQRIYSMDGSYLLGFGPRLGQAVLDLMEFLHPEVEI